MSIEYRPNLWAEVLLKLGGKYIRSCKIPESVLHLASPINPV